MGATPWRFKSSPVHHTKPRPIVGVSVSKKDASLHVLLPLGRQGALESHKHYGRLAQLVRASRLHREGRRFESYSVHQTETSDNTGRFCYPSGI